MPGIRDLLHAAAERMSEAGIEGGRLDARILLAQAMQITRDELIAASRKPTTDEAERFEALIRRRLALPIEKRMNFLRKRVTFRGSAL